jgi:hypothetical protein
MLKAIGTYYNGHRFRSRLEARWAVFFDVLGVKYDYEPQGYRFADYAYLPDFWIAEWDSFIEIKPSLPDADEMERYISFAQHAGKNLLLFYDNPGRYQIAWCSPQRFEAKGLTLAWCWDECGQTFIQSHEWGAWALGDAGTGHDCWKPAAGPDEDIFVINGLLPNWPWHTALAEKALITACSARFEYGENGGTADNSITP